MSDGVEESLSAKGELFGKKRIMKVLVDKQSARAGRIVAKLHQAGRAHEEADQQPDDFTTIVLKVK
jgi:serine phosphatase RsbU (regulator of sigma subunit)